MSELIRVARRELDAFFGSPVAYLFIGAFLTVSLFVFFWVDAFFARNLADVRPLFEWMPVLLIVLCAALTMRSWSEERRAGTLEVLLTLPVPIWRLVAGKFLAALALVAIALALTLPLPLTVSLLGPLDWGPVFGAYLGALLLAAAYLAIGLFVSARTDNPIVALIGTVIIGALAYAVGASALTHLVGHGPGEWLRLLGTGARFESIGRGVIDPRDLYYYLSLTGVFLALSVYSLERLGWAEASANPRHHRRWVLVTGLVVANLLAANLWLHGSGAPRLDLTEGRQHSLSPATREYLAQLQEPLLIRGYFSAETHPLLAPLVPQLRDLLREYQIAGGGQVRVEIVDPQRAPDLEREAAERYGIRPAAFQIASKYQAAVVSSYFDLLIQYGDEVATLGFSDLIDVKLLGETDLEVRLRNPEYDLTRAIRKVLHDYRAGGDPFTRLARPLRFEGFISEPEDLPAPLPELRADLEAVLAELSERSQGRLSVRIRDPLAGDGALAERIAEEFGFEPLVISLFDPQPFYFYMLLETAVDADGDPAALDLAVQRVPVPLPETLDRAGLERSITAAIKRFAPGVARTVTLVTPAPALSPFGMPGASGPGFTLLRERIGESFTLRETDLASGRVPEDTDLLVVVGPEALDERQQFALDQYLMQGGTLILAASRFDLDLGGGTIGARPIDTGLEDWLAHQGLTLEPTLVLDPQNMPFPIPVQRDLGGFLIEEIQTLDYPYFPDVRGDGLAADSPITAHLGQLTLNWVSPIQVDADVQGERRIQELIRSSPRAWTSADTDMQPDFAAHGALGFPRGATAGRQLLAVAIEGRFQSFFAGRPSPLLPTVDPSVEPTVEPSEAADDDGETTAPDDPWAPETDDTRTPVVSAVVESSPDSARLILIGSSSFLSDTAISLATEATQSRYLNALDLMQNALDWSVEDPGLLELRGRGQFSRLLDPLGREGRIMVETLNYLLALGGLILVYWLHRLGRARRAREASALLAPLDAAKGAPA